MGLLSPLYLLGLLAIGVPIFLHLRKRPPKDAQVFSSTMFLEASREQRTRRSKLDHLLLLLLRCLAIGLLALLFGRPFLRKDPDALLDGEGRKVMLLVDASASMQRDGLWESAEKEVKKIAASLSDVDRVGLYSFTDIPVPLFEFNQSPPIPAGERPLLMSTRLAATTPTWRAADLAAVLSEASQSVFEDGEEDALEPAASHEIHLIGDLAEGQGIAALQSISWPGGLRLFLHPLVPKKQGNASLRATAPPAWEADAPVIAHIENAAGSGLDTFALAWDGAAAGSSINVVIAAGETTRVPAPPLSSELAAKGAVLRLTGDPHDFDNVAYLAPRHPRPLRVLYLGADADAESPDAPLFFLRRALGESGVLKPEVLDWENSGAAFDPPDAVVIAGLAALTDEQRSFANSYLNTGGRVLQVLVPEDSETLKGDAIEDAGDGDFAMLEDIDFRHSAFAAFSDPSMRDFTGLRFWRHRSTSIPEGARVVARFDDSDPALLEIPASEGGGMLLVLASGWHPADSQLALSTKFVPFLFGLLTPELGAPGAAPIYYVGDSLPGDVPIPDEPKIVRIPATDPTDPENVYAVNLHPSESQLEALTEADFLAMEIPVGDEGAASIAGTEDTGVSARQKRTGLIDAAQESRQKLWRLFLLIALLAVLGETWLGGLRRGRLDPEPTPAP